MTIRNMNIAIGMAAVSVVGGLLGWHYLGHSTSTETAFARPIPPVPVVTTLVTQADVPIYLNGVGTVAGFNTDIVRSQIQGQLSKVVFVEGQSVIAGNLLAEIDPRPYQAQLDQNIATRDRDQALLTNALVILDRDSQLLSRGFATQEVTDTQKSQVLDLQNTVKADNAQIEQARIQLSYTQLASPISGIAGIRQIDVGNVIHPTDVNGLVTVTQIEPISLVFSLPQSELTKVQDAMGKTTLKVLARSQDDVTELGEGTLELLNNEIIQSTGSIQLKATFLNKERRLWPGQLVNVRLLLETQTAGLTVPASTVQEGQTGSFVFVVSPDNIVKLQPVIVSQIANGRALIEQGLRPGDTVVVDGQYRLQNGSSVNILHGKAATRADLQSAVQKAIP